MFALMMTLHLDGGRSKISLCISYQRLDKVQISGGARSLKIPENAWFSYLGGAKSTKNA